MTKKGVIMTESRIQLTSIFIRPKLHSVIPVVRYNTIISNSL